MISSGAELIAAYTVQGGAGMKCQFSYPDLGGDYRTSSVTSRRMMNAIQRLQGVPGDGKLTRHRGERYIIEGCTVRGTLQAAVQIA